MCKGQTGSESSVNFFSTTVPKVVSLTFITKASFLHMHTVCYYTVRPNIPPPTYGYKSRHHQISKKKYAFLVFVFILSLILKNKTLRKPLHQYPCWQNKSVIQLKLLTVAFSMSLGNEKYRTLLSLEKKITFFGILHCVNLCIQSK